MRRLARTTAIHALTDAAWQARPLLVAPGNIVMMAEELLVQGRRRPRGSSDTEHQATARPERLELPTLGFSLPGNFAIS
jgi:hypothetical protein